MILIEEYYDEEIFAMAWEVESISLETMAAMWDQIPSDIKESLDRRLAFKDIKKEQLVNGKFIVEYIVRPV